MFLVLSYILLGFFLGVIAGLIPGLHPNTIAIMVSSLGIGLGLPTIPLVSLIVSCSVVNSFVNFIPSIYLGAPEGDSALSVLPGHRMLLKGLGHQAVVLTVMGGVGSFLFCLFALPVVMFLVPPVYEILRPNTHLLLMGVVVYMLYRSKNRWGSGMVLFLSGALGYLALEISSKSLFPLLSGLFGLPLLYTSFSQRNVLPEQKTEVLKVDKKSFGKASLIGGAAGLIAGLLPGIGSAQATVFAKEIGKSKKTTEFLMSIGGVNTADIVFSFLALFLIGNPRSGAAIVVGGLMDVGMPELLLLLAVSLLSVGLAALSTVWLSKVSLKIITRINYRLLCSLVFFLVIVLVYIFNGLFGVFLSLIALSIGLFCINIGVRKSFMMGVLILPTIAYFTL